jgi:FkbM family methyltransferase
VTDRTVAFRPFGDRTYSITGEERDAGVVGELERSGGRYQQDLALLLQRHLPADGVAVDGGAHIGVVTILLAALCPQGHVYAFEPAPASHAYLLANLATNGAGNATAERCALLDREGEISFSYNDAYPAGSHVGDGAEGDVRVPGVRLDTWADQRSLARLDVLKLDLEGVEIAALAGAERTIRRLRPVTVVECNPFALRRFGGVHYRDLWRRLRSMFGAVGTVGSGGEVVPVLSLRHLQLLLGRDALVDLVAFPRRPPGWWPAAYRAARRWRELEAEHRRPLPPARTMVVDPAVGLTIWPPRLSGAPGAAFGVPVTVTNRSGWWLSSAFEHAVHAAYRIHDEAGAAVVAEGHRTPLPRPLAPGDSADFELFIELPPEPGRYLLTFTLVQERITWFDEVDEGAVAEVPLTVVE